MRRALLAASLLALSYVVPAHADGTHWLVLRGSRSAGVDLTFRTRFEPYVGYGWQDGPQPRLTTRGTFVGVTFERIGAGGYALSAALLVPAMRPGFFADPVLQWGVYPNASPDDSSLPPGTYRVRLLTDGRAEARIAVGGLARDIVRTPAARVDASAKLVDLPRSADGIVGEQAVPIVVRDRAMVLASVYARGTATPHEEVCLTPATVYVSCGTNGRNDEAGMKCDGTSSAGICGTVAFRGDLPAGERSASFRAVAAGAQGRMLGFVVVIAP